MEVIKESEEEEKNLSRVDEKEDIEEKEVKNKQHLLSLKKRLVSEEEIEKSETPEKLNGNEEKLTESVLKVQDQENKKESEVILVLSEDLSDLNKSQKNETLEIIENSQPSDEPVKDCKILLSKSDIIGTPENAARLSNSLNTETEKINEKSDETNATSPKSTKKQNDSFTSNITFRNKKKDPSISPPETTQESDGSFSLKLDVTQNKQDSFNSDSSEKENCLPNNDSNVNKTPVKAKASPKMVVSALEDYYEPMEVDESTICVLEDKIETDQEEELLQTSQDKTDSEIPNKEIYQDNQKPGIQKSPGANHNQKGIVETVKRISYSHHESQEPSENQTDETKQMEIIEVVTEKNTNKNNLNIVKKETTEIVDAVEQNSVAILKHSTEKNEDCSDDVFNDSWRIVLTPEEDASKKEGSDEDNSSKTTKEKRLETSLQKEDKHKSPRNSQNSVKSEDEIEECPAVEEICLDTSLGKQEKRKSQEHQQKDLVDQKLETSPNKTKKDGEEKRLETSFQKRNKRKSQQDVPNENSDVEKTYPDSSLQIENDFKSPDHQQSDLSNEDLQNESPDSEVNQVDKKENAYENAMESSIETTLQKATKENASAERTLSVMTKIESLIKETVATFSDSDDSDETSHDFILHEAEEGEEDTPSEDSNAIIDDGESINTTSSEFGSSDEYEVDSFITDDEAKQLLSGEEYDIFDDDQIISNKGKKSRIIRPTESSDEEIEIEIKQIQSPEKLRRCRIIRPTESSDEETSCKSASDDFTDEKSNSELDISTTTIKKSVPILENVRVEQIGSETLITQISEAVGKFFADISKNETSEINLNLSLDYSTNSCKGFDETISVPSAKVEEVINEKMDSDSTEQKEVNLSTTNLEDVTTKKKKKTRKLEVSELEVNESGICEAENSFTKKKKKSRKSDVEIKEEVITIPEEKTEVVTESVNVISENLNTTIEKKNKRKKDQRMEMIETAENMSELNDMKASVSKKKKRRSVEQLQEKAVTESLDTEPVPSPGKDETIAEITEQTEIVVDSTEEVSKKKKKKKFKDHNLEDAAPKKKIKVQQEEIEEENPMDTTFTITEVPKRKDKKPKGKKINIISDFVITTENVTPKGPIKDNKIIEKLGDFTVTAEKTKENDSSGTNKKLEEKVTEKSISKNQQKLKILPSKEPILADDVKVDYFPNNLLSKIIEQEEEKKKSKRPSLIVTRTMEQSSWDVEPVPATLLKPSKACCITPKKVKKSKKSVPTASSLIRSKDFKTQMLFDPNHVRRIDSKTLLRKKLLK